MNSTKIKILKKATQDLPYASSDLSGIGGVLKAEPEHFQVAEILCYSPCGEGEHVFVTLRRQGWNTTDAARILGQVFQLKKMDIGWAGRKDKHAVTVQTFSLRLPLAMSLQEVKNRLINLPFEILGVQRHRNKLKTGHAAGNRFEILLTQVLPKPLNQAQAIAAVLKKRGIPNFYGPQRFGHQQRNLERIADLLDQDKSGWAKKDVFMVSVLQSALFNLWLRQRIERNDFNCILSGDVAKKSDTGGLFTVQDTDEANQRFEKDTITYTGPIFGYKMMAAKEMAGMYETQVLETLGLELQDFKVLRAPGSRRAALLHLTDLKIQTHDLGLHFSFSLPSGAYATTVMREFMRSP